jgi:hypothetical protein
MKRDHYNSTLSSKLNEMCVRCKKECKQSYLVEIVQCPMFEGVSDGDSEHEVPKVRRANRKRRKASK